MIEHLLNYANLYKRGLCKFPEVLNILDAVRKDSIELKKQVDDMNQKSFEQYTNAFNIEGIHTLNKRIRERQKMFALKQQIQNSNSKTNN